MLKFACNQNNIELPELMGKNLQASPSEYSGAKNALQLALKCFPSLQFFFYYFR